MVRRSHTAMDSNTVLVGEDILGLINKQFIRTFFLGYKI